MKANNETTRRLIDTAKQLGGCYVGVNGTGHLLFRFENGETARISSSPSEFRGMKNAQLEMERVSGRRLPRRVSRRSRKNFAVAGFAPTAGDRANSARVAELAAQLEADANVVVTELREIFARNERRDVPRALELGRAYDLIQSRRAASHLPPLPELPFLLGDAS